MEFDWTAMSNVEVSGYGVDADCCLHCRSRRTGDKLLDDDDDNDDDDNDDDNGD